MTDKLLHRHTSQAASGPGRAPASLRLLVVLAMVAMAVVLVLPHLFVVVEAHHRCTGDDCPICHVITSCVQVEQQGGTVPDGLMALLSFALVAAMVLPGIRHPSAPETPISLKVRLDC